VQAGARLQQRIEHVPAGEAFGREIGRHQKVQFHGDLCLRLLEHLGVQDKVGG